MNTESSHLVHCLGQIEELKEEIEKLKEENDKFKCAKCKGHHTGCANPTCDTCVEELKEENEKLKKEQEVLLNFYGHHAEVSLEQCAELKDENKQLTVQAEAMCEFLHSNGFVVCECDEWGSEDDFSSGICPECQGEDNDVAV